jgi:hypothetical protein
VLCSRVERPSGETKRCFRGAGNLYARHGMARELLTRAEEIERQDAIDDMEDAP